MERYGDLQDFLLCYNVTSTSERLSSLIHYHEYFEICFCIDVNMEVFMSDVRYDLVSRDILVIPPGKIHAINYLRSHKYIRYHLFVSGDYVKRVCLDTVVSDFFLNGDELKISLSFEEYVRVLHLFENMISYMRIKDFQQSCLPSAYVSAIFYELYQIHCESPISENCVKREPYVERILNYLDQHYTEDITLELLEEVLHMSRTNICRVFRKAMGVTVISYVQYKRILKAQELLVSSSLAVIDISIECGFNNLQHFFRVFKKYTGITPRQYKKCYNPTGLTSLDLLV